MSSVLVAYASTGGSTREVAEAIAETLRERGNEVTLQSVKDVTALEGYSAVVLGVPIYNMLMHLDARQFLSRHKDALNGRSVAIFALGPVQKGEPVEFERSSKQLDTDLKHFPWVKPVSIVMFGGKMKATDSGFPLNLLFKPTPAVDFRDWDAIRTWAYGLPDLLTLHEKLGS